MLSLKTMNNFLFAIVTSVAVAAALLCPDTIHAQYFYFKGDAGYGFGFSRTFLGEKINIHTPVNPPFSTDRQGVYGSLGRGMAASVSAGYMITPIIGIELVGSYTIGAETDPFRTVNFASLVPEVGAESTLQASISAISPSVVLCFTEKGTVPYARFGVHIAFPTMKLREQAYVNPYVDDGVVKDASTKTYTGGISVGMQYGVGVRIPLVGNIGLAAEAWMIAASWGPEQLEAGDGTVLVEYRESSSSQPGENGDRQELQPRFTLSTAGISLGLLYRL